MLRYAPNVMQHLEDPSALMQAVEQGSPLVLRTAGRFLGLGQDEQRMLVNGEVPVWVWATGALALGVFAGVMVERHKDRLPWGK